MSYEADIAVRHGIFRVVSSRVLLLCQRMFCNQRFNLTNLHPCRHKIFGLIQIVFQHSKPVKFFKRRNSWCKS
ncbi:hypothetical protein BDV24DRAFT_146195, partial [Aspergillus arachidicola]